MVSVCLPYDALSQHLPSYLGFSYLGCGVTLHSCSSKVRPCSLPWTKSISSLATPPDLEHGVVPLGPLAPKQATRLGCGLLLLAASLKYSCLENPMNRMKRQNDRILKEELLRSVGAQYATGDQWSNNSRKNEGMKPKQTQYPVVDVTGDRSKVRCCKSNIA